nr:type II toxin-antitoxin system RelE/ParE family toxin [Bradyrhizobium diazoefficiens]
MPKRPLKSPQTEVDFTAIWDYIAAESLRAADTLIDRIDATFDMLAETPFAGRDRSELRAYPHPTVLRSSGSCMAGRISALTTYNS